MISGRLPLRPEASNVGEQRAPVNHSPLLVMPVQRSERL